jgi:threonine aldolase
MREAMARAEVGDDVYGEDPTVNRLEAEIAAITGKEAAIFVPSGTMGNQIALQCHTQRGEEVLLGESAHLSFDESGAGAAWAGVQFRTVGRGGLFTAAELAGALQEPDDHCATQRLVALENPHNRGGGITFAQADALAIAALARSKGLKLHLDGARIWNAAVALGLSPAELAAPFDTVNVCFSKGLGAPVGSALCGSRATITAARRFRKMFGGGMRQAGVLAAAARYALEHHRERIAEDHAAARQIAAALRAVPGAIVHDGDTNQVNIDTPSIPAARLVEAARERGVLVGAMGPHRTRAVTHLDVTWDDVPVASHALVEVLVEVLSAPAVREG